MWARPGRGGLWGRELATAPKGEVAPGRWVSPGRLAPRCSLQMPLPRDPPAAGPLQSGQPRSRCLWPRRALKAEKPPQSRDLRAGPPRAASSLRGPGSARCLPGWEASGRPLRLGDRPLRPPGQEGTGRGRAGGSVPRSPQAPASSATRSTHFPPRVLLFSVPYVTSRVTNTLI